MGIQRGFSEELDDIIESVICTKDVMSVVLSRSWEEGSLSDGEGKEFIIQRDVMRGICACFFGGC